MTKKLEFFFDVGSPAAYLAWTQLPAICRSAGAEFIEIPMLLGGVFQATGNASPATIPVKGKYTTMDYARHARRYGVPFVSNPHFPIITLTHMRAVMAVQMHQPERLNDFLACLFKALWVDALNLNDVNLVVDVLEKGGFDPAQILALTNDPEVKGRLRANTEAAVARGVFGAPTSFVGEEMFFGQDRLDFIKEALAR
jgi:2-hydroxychromene-2-carboxylate isomerase